MWSPTGIFGGMIVLLFILPAEISVSLLVLLFILLKEGDPWVTFIGVILPAAGLFLILCCFLLFFFAPWRTVCKEQQRKPTVQEQQRASYKQRSMPSNLYRIPGESFETVVEKIIEDMNTLNQGLTKTMLFKPSLSSIGMLTPPFKHDDCIADVELALGNSSEGAHHVISQPQPSSTNRHATEHEACNNGGHVLAVGGDCFLATTLVVTTNSEFRTNLVPMTNLTAGDFVKGVFGFAQVRSIRIHHEEQCELVVLDAGIGTSRLTVTSAHRIVTCIEGRASKTVPASNLKSGESILCSHGMQILRGVERIVDSVDIAHVSFMPDVPVEAFDPVPQHSILSKGNPRIRRGGMHKHADNADILSVPDTDYSWPVVDLL